eukprot:m.9243 g.9243  ORF g.9243 m.9243 type:complete len:508 (-) comp4634_c0_seq1:724-2247(-)
MSRGLIPSVLFIISGLACLTCVSLVYYGRHASLQPRSLNSPSAVSSSLLSLSASNLLLTTAETPQQQQQQDEVDEPDNNSHSNNNNNVDLVKQVAKLTAQINELKTELKERAGNEARAVLKNWMESDLIALSKHLFKLSSDPAGLEKGAVNICKRLSESPFNRVETEPKLSGPRISPFRANGESQIVFHKTHKTGSTTVSSILFRLLARRQLRMLRYYRGITALPREWFDQTKAYKIPEANKHAFNVSLLHISSPRGMTNTMQHVRTVFRQYIDNPFIFSIVRDPKQHILSWICYFLVPRSPAQLGNLLRQRQLKNLQAADFGCYTQDCVAALTAPAKRLAANASASASGGSASDPAVQFFMVTERFDESLVLLRRIMNWDMQDITYLKVLDSHAFSGAVRYDGRIIMETPTFASLPVALQAVVKELTPLDTMLYERANARLDELITLYDDGTFKDEVEHFQSIQTDIRTFCNANRFYPACTWYALSDTAFLGEVNATGFAKPMSFC